MPRNYDVAVKIFDTVIDVDKISWVVSNLCISQIFGPKHYNACHAPEAARTGPVARTDLSELYFIRPCTALLETCARWFYFESEKSQP